MSSLATLLNVQRVRRFDGPEFFLGGGFLAGLLVFLVWLATLPGHDHRSLRARNAGAESADALAAPGEGVLSGITGDSDSGGAVASVSEDDSTFLNNDDEQAADPSLEYGEAQADADSMAVGEDVGAPAQPEEGAALTDGLLDSPPAPAEPADAAAAAPASAPGAPLLSYYVEVEVAPGQTQVLQLNAESPEHARAILRDFRGDPRVLRGPTTEPLQ